MTKQVRKKCAGRTPGNVLTSYECSRYAREGSEYCYWHDPATDEERMERTRRQMADRRLEREDREARLRARLRADSEQQEAQEILNLHADAELAGIAYSTDQAEIERAGWDHFPPTPAQVRKAHSVLDGHQKQGR